MEFILFHYKRAMYKLVMPYDLYNNVNNENGVALRLEYSLI